jgi:ectoine hydroxylase
MNEFILPVGCTDPDLIAAVFATHGVVVMPGLFHDAETDAAKAAIDAWAGSPAAQPPRDRGATFDLHQTQVVPWHPIGEGETSFVPLRDHPRLAAATAAAIGCSTWGDGCMVMLSRPGHLQAWHQDTDSDEPGQFFINRLLYPWDVDPRAGAVVCVPGSHRAGTIPPGEPHGPIPGEVAVAPQAGTLVILHSRCFHRVTRNDTTGVRVSVNFRVHPAGSRHDLGRYGVYRTGTYDFATNTTTITAVA